MIENIFIGILIVLIIVFIFNTNNLNMFNLLIIFMVFNNILMFMYIKQQNNNKFGSGMNTTDKDKGNMELEYDVVK